MPSRAWKVLPAIRRPICLLTLSAALSGCLTPQDRAQNPNGFSLKQQAMYDYLISEGMEKNLAVVTTLNPGVQQMYFDDKKCRSYGAKPGSDAYITCRAQLEAGNKAAEARQAPVIVQSPAAGPVMAPPAPPSTVTCLKTGAMTTCNQM